MGKKRFTDTDKFNDVWYRKLPLLQKCIWEYLLAECNHAGIFENLDLEMMSFKIGEIITLSDLNYFNDRIIFIDEKTLFIPKFIDFQYGKLNVQSKVHLSVIKELNKYSIEYSIDRVSIPYQKGIDTIKDKDKDKDINKDNNIININEPTKKNKKIDPYANNYISEFKKQHKKIIGKIVYLNRNECNALTELAYDIEDFESTIPLVLEKLKKLKFENIGYTPTASWLFKDNHYTEVLNGAYDVDNFKRKSFSEQKQETIDKLFGG